LVYWANFGAIYALIFYSNRTFIASYFFNAESLATPPWDVIGPAVANLGVTFVACWFMGLLRGPITVPFIKGVLRLRGVTPNVSKPGVK